MNFFQRSFEITRKSNLLKNLRNLVWFKNIDINSFFPRCYELSNSYDFEAFTSDYKYTKAESYLKLYLNDKKNVSLEQVKASIKIIKKKIKTFSEIMDIPNVKK